MIRPWHRRCIGVSKPPRVEQPVVPAVRKPFSNNNENNIWWDRVRTCVCTFVNRKTPFPFNSKTIFGSRIKIIVKLNPFYLSTSVPFTSEKCHEFPKLHLKNIVSLSFHKGLSQKCDNFWIDSIAPRVSERDSVRSSSGKSDQIQTPRVSHTTVSRFTLLKQQQRDSWLDFTARRRMEVDSLGSPIGKTMVATVRSGRQDVARSRLERNMQPSSRVIQYRSSNFQGSISLWQH